MKNLFLASFLGIVLSLSACNSSVNHSETTAVSTDSGKNVNAQPANNKIVGQAYHSYLILKNKLVESSVQEIKTAATKLETDLSAVKGCEEAQALARKIANEDQLKEQRSTFTVLSNDMITLVKREPLGEKMFVQFCPMANNDKGGYWLSDKEVIENPYYGSDMLNCGMVKETLN